MDRMQHPSNNGVLGAPPGYTYQDCMALPITRVEYGGGPCVISYWRPDAEEIALIVARKPVMLLVQGTTHAPVFVGVEGE